MSKSQNTFYAIQPQKNSPVGPTKAPDDPKI